MDGSGIPLSGAALGRDMKLFGSSGTRGVANEELTPEFATRVAAAAGTVWEADRAALARDTRTTGPMLEAAAAAGLASAGADVDRLGIVPTPGLQAYAEAEGIPGVMITASHNPAEYNGIKLVGADGVELAVDALEAVEAVFTEDRSTRAPWDEVGRLETVDGARERYVEGLHAAVDGERIREASLTVALDPGHGAGSVTSPEFLRRLGCRVVTVNAQPDGTFPGRNPEPVAGNLSALCRLVRAEEADLGIAHDGDADRAIFVDETGAVVEGDAALAALAEGALSAGDVAVSAVNVSNRLVDVVEARDARLERTPIGSTHILTRIRALLADGERVPIGGEGNGGIVFPDHRLARDGAYTAARFLALVAAAPASEVVAPHGGYASVRSNVRYDDPDRRSAMVEAARRFAEEAEGTVTTVDGYRIDFDDGAWVLVRPSGTEPLVRIYAEAEGRERAAALVEQVEAALEAAD